MLQFILYSFFSVAVQGSESKSEGYGVNPDIAPSAPIYLYNDFTEGNEVGVKSQLVIPKDSTGETKGMNAQFSIVGTHHISDGVRLGLSAPIVFDSRSSYDTMSFGNLGVEASVYTTTSSDSQNWDYVWTPLGISGTLPTSTEKAARFFGAGLYTGLFAARDIYNLKFTAGGTLGKYSSYDNKLSSFYGTGAFAFTKYRPFYVVLEGKYSYQQSLEAAGLGFEIGTKRESYAQITPSFQIKYKKFEAFIGPEIFLAKAADYSKIGFALGGSYNY